MRGIGKKFRASVAGGLSFCLALSGMPAAMFDGAAGGAEAASASIVRIANAGPGARKSLKLGLNRPSSSIFRPMRTTFWWPTP